MTSFRRVRAWRALILGACLGATTCAGRPSSPPATPEAAHLARLRAYIHETWPLLTRSLRDLPRAAIDPKADHRPGQPWPVYLPPNSEVATIDAALRALLPPDARATIVLRTLPALPALDVAPGLLYLPRPYVVPGGRFNEMYGWDSAFILIGLLAERDFTRARDVVDNAIFEVTHYGGVLNANRTFALSRGQPPFLGAMVWTVYQATGDRAWLARAREAVVAEHAHWTAAPHLVPTTGLSRYFDHGEGPAPEVLSSERDAAGHTHYDRVRATFRSRAAVDPTRAFELAPYYDAAADALTPLFFKDDRAMRESGFDPTDRFGPFGAGTTGLVPVCLNTLLYAMELDLATIDTALARPTDAAVWTAQAAARQGRMDALLWDERAGFYFDYDFSRGARRPYPFATTFWPLWAGLATPAQARRVRDNLASFERPGGIVTSTHVSGSQWDAPFGWAPLQYLAVEGLRRAGYRVDAERIARAFLDMLVDDFDRRGTLVEKYDVERRTSALGGTLKYGYTSNEVGFGWTNAIALWFMRERDNPPSGTAAEPR
jgi:alpha,alpha-trehalase